MDTDEARALLAMQLAEWRAKSYEDLARQMKEPVAFELRGSSGVAYQIEIATFWDDKPGGNILVTGSIDDGGWRAFTPLTESFIMKPDGSFIGE